MKFYCSLKNIDLFLLLLVGWSNDTKTIKLTFVRFCYMSLRFFVIFYIYFYIFGFVTEKCAGVTIGRIKKLLEIYLRCGTLVEQKADEYSMYNLTLL